MEMDSNIGIWKDIDEDLFNVPRGTYVLIYYKDIQYNRYDYIVLHPNLMFDKDSYKHSVYHCCSKNYIPVKYFIVPACGLE